MQEWDYKNSVFTGVILSALAYYAQKRAFRITGSSGKAGLRCLFYTFSAHCIKPGMAPEFRVTIGVSWIVRSA